MVQLAPTHLPSVDAPAAPEPGLLAPMLAQRASALAGGLDELRQESSSLDLAAMAMLRSLRSGGKVLVAGNGGSAAQAQHFATELVGRFKRERAAYAVLALTADSSIVSAIANDYGYDRVFSRQVEAFGQPGDVLVALSTSGASENVVQAAACARMRGMTVITITGRAPSRLARYADVAVCVPAAETALIQELHMVVLHLLCDVVEGRLASDDAGEMGRD